MREDDLALARTSLATIAAQASRTAPFQIRPRRKDGGWTLLWARGRNLLGVPAVRGIVKNHRDITERNRFRDQLSRPRSSTASTGRRAAWPTTSTTSR